MYEVFINNKPLIFAASEQEVKAKRNWKILNTAREAASIQDIIQLLETNDSVRGMILVSTKNNKLWERFCKEFTLIKAAGGIVVNPKGQLLFIYRNKKWDLPKGKMEKGEQPEETALREIAEETGISDLKLTGFIKETYHTYVLDGKPVLKKTFWFELACNSNMRPVPQVEEGITKVKWMKKQEVNKALAKTYSLIQGLTRDFLNQK